MHTHSVFLSRKHPIIRSEQQPLTSDIRVEHVPLPAVVYNSRKWGPKDKFDQS